MRYLIFGLLSVALLAGCAYNRYQDDVADNQYNETPIHAVADATYVGEWTAASDVGIRSLKITGAGRVKVCLAPSSGTRNGKVYLDNGLPALILETGAKVKLVGTTKDFLLLDIYGKQEKYYAGLVDEACVPAFANFE